MAKQRASVLLIVLGLAIVLFLLYKSYSKTKEGFATAPVVPPVMSSPGIITTIAGTGAVGSAGDNGSATAATLNYPKNITIDSAGNIYIADKTNSKIRKINTSGIITTIAGTGTAGFKGDGGLATAATLLRPQGVAVDSSGNVYIADTENHRIRKINTSGIITTIAGTGTAGFKGDWGLATAAQLNGPCDVTVDPSGNIFIADSTNNRIRMIPAKSDNTGFYVSFSEATTPVIANYIYTIAGNGAAPSGKIVQNGIGLANPSGGPCIGSPWSIESDKKGNIYVANFGNWSVIMIARGGSYKPGTSTGASPFPTLCSTYRAGYLYRLTGKGDVAADDILANTAIVNPPSSVALDNLGNLYLTEYGFKVKKINAITGIITTIAGGSQGYSGDNGPATSAGLQYPAGCAIDSSGNVFIADYFNHRIRKIAYIQCIPNTISCKTLTDFVCAPGFSNSGTACVPCPAGWTCSGTVNTGCPIGTSCDQWSSNITSCTNCLAGTYNSIIGGTCLTCPTNITSCSTSNFVCQPGFSNNGTACVPCPPGFACSGTANTACATGTFSLVGQTTCTPCVAGTYANLIGQSNCITCPPNSVCVTGGSSATATGLTSLVCMPGFSNTGTACVPCPNGFACSGTANTACAAGTYSQGGLVTCSNCETGTYNPLTGKSNCITCPSNITSCTTTSYTCATGFSNTGTNCLGCPAGYSCSGTVNTPCAAGTYSLAGQTTCTPCAAGTYTSQKGQSACIPCLPNSVCAVGGAQTAQTGISALICQPGFSNTGTACTTCPPGYGCSGLTNTACATGTYSEGGLNTCSKCGAGTYINLTGQSACLSCPSGSTCSVGGTQAAATGLGALVCQPGFSNTGTACTTCPPGYGCSGLTNTACAINTYSSSGQVTCTNCPAGSYNTVTGSSNCGSSCPVPNSVACTSATSFICAAGYYSNAGGCTICPSGSTCAPGGTSYLPGQTSFRAMSGYVCTGNSCIHNQYATTLPKFSQGSIINMNNLLPGINTSNCDKTDSCLYDWTIGSNVTPGPASANPCLALNSWYDFDKKNCVTGSGATATAVCASNTVYNSGTNSCINVQKPFANQPANTIGKPSLIKPGDFGNCKSSDKGDCIPFFKNPSGSFTPMNPCRPPTKYDYSTQSCTTANPCCGLTIDAATSNALCRQYVIPATTYTAIAAKCPRGSTNICCSATKQTLAACASYWKKGTSYQFNPSYKKVCAAGFQDYNNGIDTIADKRSKWTQSKQLINA